VAGDREDGHRSREGSPEGDRVDGVTLDGRGVPVFPFDDEEIRGLTTELIAAGGHP